MFLVVTQYSSPCVCFFFNLVISKGIVPMKTVLIFFYFESVGSTNCVSRLKVENAKKNGKQECKILYKIFKPLKFSSKWRKPATFKDFGLNQMFNVLLY